MSIGLTNMEVVSQKALLLLKLQSMFGNSAPNDLVEYTCFPTRSGGYQTTVRVMLSDQTESLPPKFKYFQGFAYPTKKMAENSASKIALSEISKMENGNILNAINISDSPFPLKSGNPEETEPQFLKKIPEELPSNVVFLCISSFWLTYVFSCSVFIQQITKTFCREKCSRCFPLVSRNPWNILAWSLRWERFKPL